MSPSILITGATGGIGKTLCSSLAVRGYAIVAVSRSLAKAQALVAALPGGGHMAAQAEVTDSTSLAVLASQVQARFRHLDALVNCHGITTPVPHADLDALSDDWIDRILQTNVRGTFASVRAFKPLLLAAPHPVIVNISSVAGTTGVGSNVAYCASKAAVDSITRSLARALAPRIRVLSVAPGWVLGEYALRFPAEYIAQQTQATPTQRLASPQDVADAVYAAIALLTNSTGDIIHVNGGRPLGL